MKNTVIFVLDNNAIHRNMIRHNLVTAGFLKTISVPSFSEFIYQIEKGVIPDFVIADYLAIAQEPTNFMERCINCTQLVRVIIFTNNDDPDLAKIFMEHGAFDYILKSGPELKGLAELRKNLQYLADPKFNVTR